MLENTIGNLGQEVRQPSNAFANLAERGLLCVQQNALKALLPDLDVTNYLPRGSIHLGNGYVLLRARQKKPTCLESEIEITALWTYLASCGIQLTEAQPLIQKWAHLLLPNQQVVRSSWKDGHKSNGRNSQNVKVCSLFVVLQLLLTGTN